MKITIPVNCATSFDDESGKIECGFTFGKCAKSDEQGRSVSLPQELQVAVLVEIHRTLSISLLAMGAAPEHGIVTFKAEP